MSALRRLAASMVQHAGRTCEPGATLGRRCPAAAFGASWSARGSALACRALYHKHNPYDFRTVREEGEEMPGVRNLEDSIDEMDEQRKKVERGLEGAKTAALKLLSARPHSRKELKGKLLERGHELDAVRAALDRLQDVGLQSDPEFAEVFARSKWRQSKWGPKRIEHELHRRGVGEEVAAAALASVFGGGLDVREHLERTEGEGEGVPRGLWDHASPEQQLVEDARRSWTRMEHLSEDTRRRRFVGWLQRRGHRWEDIRGLMHQLEKEDAQRAIDADP